MEFHGCFSRHQIKIKNKPHIAAGLHSVPTGTDHVLGDQGSPPIGLGASGEVNDGEQGLLKDVSDGAIGWGHASASSSLTR